MAKSEIDHLKDLNAEMLTALKASLPIMSENMRDGLERGDGSDFKAAAMIRAVIEKAGGKLPAAA